MKSETQITHLDIDEKFQAVNDGHSPSWGAIFAGATAGLAVQFLLLMLGTATGLGAAQPATDDNPIATFGIGAALVWSVSALISLFVGGWVAGRYAARGHRVTGCVHGFMVWALATVIGLLLVTSGAGALVGGAARIFGEGLSAVGKATGGTADLAKQALTQTTGSMDSMVAEVTETRRLKNNGAGVAAAQRQVGYAVHQLFREGGDINNPQARGALVQALRDSGMNEAEANQTVENWTASMKRMRADMEQAKQAAAAKAREAADKAASAMARAAFWAFIGFLIGAGAAAWGGLTGARWEYRHNGQSTDALLESGAMPGHV